MKTRLLHVIRNTPGAYGVVSRFARFHDRAHQNRHTQARVRRLGLTAHVGYCAAVFVEGHGVYPVLAGLVGVVLLAEWVMGEA